MYKISMPIHSNTLNEKNREKYLEWIKSGDIDRIFIVIEPNRAFDEISEETCFQLKENLRYFEKKWRGNGDLVRREHRASYAVVP